MQEAKQATAPRDDRGFHLGAGLAEGGETGIAYSLFLLLPDYLWLSADVWVAVLATAVLARCLLAFRTLGYVDSTEGSRPTDATDKSRR